MSHLFDLTRALLRRAPPACHHGCHHSAAVGPAVGWLLRLKEKHIAATVSVALTSAVFSDRRAYRLRPFCAHAQFKATGRHYYSKKVRTPTRSSSSATRTTLLRSSFSTHKFLGKPTLLVIPRCGQHGEGSTLIWGSCYPDAPDIFLSEDKAIQNLGHRRPAKWLFAQDLNQAKAESLLAGRLYPVQSIADKALWTDRPLK